MRMMFPQCCGRMTPCSRPAAQSASVMKPRDDLLAVLVDRVATFRDERVSVRDALLVKPFDAHLAAIVDHEALFVDERVSGRGAAQLAQLIYWSHTNEYRM